MANREKIIFDRNEFSGAFGDIGTDLPLVIGMIITCGLFGPSVLIVFGLMQIVAGFVYRLPMPVQPLKAAAVIAITMQLPAGTIYGAGLAIGVIMLVLTAAGLVEWLTRIVPKVVVRGVQVGLGLSLAGLALGRYVPSDGAGGLLLSLVCFILAIVFIGNRRFPPAIFIIGAGIIYSLIWKAPELSAPIPFAPPGNVLWSPSVENIMDGFLLIVVAQLPLSLANAILATKQIVGDYFPGRAVSGSKLGYTYAFMNIVSPFAGGIPVCHGSGGVAGHYVFGGRTGGSVIIEGGLYVLLGAIFASGIFDVTALFPLPVLGVILLFEGIELMKLIRGLISSARDVCLALLIGGICALAPYGFLLGFATGWILHTASARLSCCRPPLSGGNSTE